ncbi:hypothetical protein GCM10011389_14640 [Pontibacillus salipaludis]|uniref:Uncharacterized protein n=2 Tax=Pontibacillus salipaludis TaxID=1697394 RepID=A0ABQ1PZB7_9BACI|nr:hypothetical protein GCM10011389_14640 [Pontibacillus salipaludis]
MNLLAVLLMSVGLVLAPAVGFFYPSWRRIQGRDLSERQLYGFRALGTGILLLMFVLSQLFI